MIQVEGGIVFVVCAFEPVKHVCVEHNKRGFLIINVPNICIYSTISGTE